jgi:hypothetical protein
MRVTVGALSGFAVAAMCIAYAAVLAIGLLTLPSPDQAIRNPWFSMMELLILAMAPAMVGVTVGLHGSAAAGRKSLAMLSVVFVSMRAVVTSGVHFSVLTLSNHSAFADHQWAPLVFSFRWPSVAYALDILAWDLFFPLAAPVAAVLLALMSGHRQTPAESAKGAGARSRQCPVHPHRPTASAFRGLARTRER